MTKRRVWGIAAILLSLACWGGWIALIFSAIWSVADWNAPGSTTVTLSKGAWTVYQFVPESSIAVTPDQIDAARTVSSDQVSVKDAAGNPVAVTCAYCSDSDLSWIPVNARTANAIASFTAPDSGSYTITVTSQASAQMAVADPLARIEDDAVWLGVLSALGGALFVTGIVLIISGRFRGPTQPVAAAPETPPPGWYQNPYHPDSDSQMWWDGTKWTSNWR